jgi:hypothetical protein
MATNLSLYLKQQSDNSQDTNINVSRRIEIAGFIMFPLQDVGCWDFENRVLRRIFWAKSDEVTGEWRRLHNKELYDVYSSPNIIRVIKSRRLRWAAHVARLGERRGAYRA